MTSMLITINVAETLARTDRADHQPEVIVFRGESCGVCAPGDS